MRSHPNYKNLLQFKIFDKYPHIVNFSTTRIGGGSKGEFASFNLGNFSDDDPVQIYKNRTTLARYFFMDVDKFITPHQTHSNRVVLIDQALLESPKYEQIETLYSCDALITRQTDIFLCATTADCTPILLFDPVTNSTAAIHAGWRGTVARIVENAVKAMVDNFGTNPSDIIAAIGPSIGVENYEVGKEVINEFKKNKFILNSKTARKYPHSKKTFLDVGEINREELIRLGVKKNNIEKTRYNTFKNARLFFSARRQSVHCGRMLTGIMIHS